MTPWVNAQVAYLLAIWWATATIEEGKLEESDPSDYNEIVTTKDAKTTDAFSSHVIHTKRRTAHMGKGINVMTQALCADDGSLPQGLMVQNTHTELHSGSKNIAVVVRNSAAYPQTLRKKTPVVRAVTVTRVPELPVQIGLTEVSVGDHGHQMPKLTVKQRQEMLFEELDLSGLESWNGGFHLVSLGTMTSSHWNPVNLAVPIWLHMWLKLLMIPHLKSY